MASGQSCRGQAGGHVSVATWRWRYPDARWQWIYDALGRRIYRELDRDAVVTHVTVGVTTPDSKALVYAARLGMDDVQRVIVATGPATQAAAQSVLEKATTDATVPAHNGRPS